MRCDAFRSREGCVHSGDTQEMFRCPPNHPSGTLFISSFMARVFHSTNMSSPIAFWSYVVSFTFPRKTLIDYTPFVRPFISIPRHPRRLGMCGIRSKGVLVYIIASDKWQTKFRAPTATKSPMSAKIMNIGATALLSEHTRNMLLVHSTGMAGAPAMRVTIEVSSTSAF